MTQTARLLDALKFYLKVQGITYRNLAQRLKLSESSIKRLFSEESLSLKRLERILKVLDLDFYELAKMTQRNASEVQSVLDPELREVLESKPRMLVFLYLLTYGYSPEEICQNFEFTPPELNGLLLELDQLRALELYPNNRIKLRISRQALVNPDSPLWKELPAFPEMPARLERRPLVLSRESEAVLQKDWDRLLRRAEELTEADSSLPAEERKAFLLEMAWGEGEPRLVRNLRRPPQLSSP
jgi:transcriptional regulator with XRE-family HTH domain